MKKAILLILVSVSLASLSAQKPAAGYPFKGFHIGLTMQEQFIPPTTFVQCVGVDPAPYSIWEYAGSIGLEVSYNFARYFGFSAGVIYEKGGWHDEKPYLGLPGQDGVLIHGNLYANRFQQEFVKEIAIPLRLEFHFPVCKNLYLMSEAGVSITGFLNRQKFNAGDKTDYTLFCHMELPQSYQESSEQDYYNSWIKRSSNKIRCDLQLGIGAYYHLPYGDLIRLSFGANMAFKSSFQGQYSYQFTHTEGAYEVFHHYLYLQLGYFHTFDYERVSHDLKKQNRTFTSKKEKRKTIMGRLADQ